MLKQHRMAGVELFMYNLEFGVAACIHYGSLSPLMLWSSRGFVL